MSNLDQVLYVTDRGVKITRRDVDQNTWVGRIRPVSIVKVLDIKGLPTTGKIDVLYFIQIDGTMYRWSEITKTYVRILANDPDIDEAPTDGGYYARKDGQWVLIGEGGTVESDKHFTYEFMDNTAKEFIVTHNLHKYPSVKVVDTAKTEFECVVQHLSDISVKVIMNKIINHGFILFN